MININRVFAMIYRYYVTTKHNFDRLSDMFYWPAMDLFIWGLTGLYFAGLHSNSNEFMTIVLTGLIFWIIIWRTQYEINVNLLSELWDKNLVNIFTSPLRIREWIAAFMVYGFLKMIVSVSFSALLAFFLYQYSIAMYGVYVIPFTISLALTGWVVGFFVAGILIQFGEKLQTFAWTGVALIAPFSGLYYPVSALPQWAQTVSFYIPSSYIFEDMRRIIAHQPILYETIIISFVLNLFYLILSIWFFVSMFEKSRALGLGRLI